MDVERGRTVKGWRPRRLGERSLCGLGPGGPASLLHSLPLSACLAAHVFPSSLQLVSHHRHHS